MSVAGKIAGGALVGGILAAHAAVGLTKWITKKGVQKGKEQLRKQMKEDLANRIDVREALMYSGKPRLPVTNKPEATIKSATTSGHKKFQSRAGRKIGQ